MLVITLRSSAAGCLHLSTHSPDGDPVAPSGLTARGSVSIWGLGNCAPVYPPIMGAAGAPWAFLAAQTWGLSSLLTPRCPIFPSLNFTPKKCSPPFPRSEPQEGPAGMSDPASRLEDLSSPAILGICPSEKGNTDKEQNVWYGIQAQEQRERCFLSWRPSWAGGAGNLDPIPGSALFGWPWAC